jgi:UDP-glucose 4-epimerase
VKALVTGGAGFAGSHLVDALVDRGDEVVVVDDLSTGRERNLAGAIGKGADLVIEDVTREREMLRLLDAERPEVVFHLAAQIDVRVSVEKPAFDAGVNVLGTINMLEAARLAGARRFVYASTGGAIYGEGEGRQLPLAEDAECLPEAGYGQAKFAAEGYVALYRRLYGLSGVSLRFGNIYGPRQDPLGEAGVVAIFCGRLAEGKPPIVFGDGRQTRDYIYVGDAVEAMLAAQAGQASGEINIGTGDEVSVLDLVDHLGRIAGRADLQPEMAPARPGEVQRISIDPTLASSELGWAPATKLADGLERTWADIGNPPA